MNIGPYYAQDSNYYRTQDEMVRDFEDYMTEESDGTPFRMPTVKEVCPNCQGKGTMVNRSIDGHGLSMDDPDLDEEFWEGYWGGNYDVVCDECKGNNVLDVVDESRLDPEIVKEWHDWQRDVSDSVAEQLAEMRMGA